jgi:PIN domain nuclease of toxin-antitoxin system
MNDHYLIDTHALHWHWANPSKLPSSVRAIFTEANSGRACLIISYVVLLELFYLYKKLDCTEEFRNRLKDLEISVSFRLEPVSIQDIVMLPEFESIPEMHDRILVIQAARLGVPIVTKDVSIRKSNQIVSIWD